MALRGNLLVGQSGGPTAVINASLLGMVEEARQHTEIEHILGVHFGAAAALARTDANDAPHLIYVPERPLLANEATEQVRRVVTQHGYAVIVVAETVRDGNGQPWARQTGSDGFGHVRLVGTAERLGALIEERLGYKTRFNKQGSLQRSAGTCVSTVDWEEAYLVGQVAVARAIDGARDVMVTLLRQPGPVYKAATGLAVLVDVAHTERRLPPQFLDDQGSITPAFLATYAR